MKANKCILLLAASVWTAAAVAQMIDSTPGAGGVGNARYATDAYPGFDVEDETVKPEKKEPRWFSWITGPNRDNASDQYAYCQELVAEGNFSKAAKQLDALVRNWPTAPEAWKAQQQLAEIQVEPLKDFEDAFKSYRYLLDFYSLQCDYKAIADKLYQLAGILKIEGKEIMFVRFANTVDVRRAYEQCVLRAPGAAWVPEAMLTVAALRVDEGKPEEAVKVYGNLRNLHPDTEFARTAVYREAEVRMSIIREHEYNRSRCQDTINYLRLALRTCRPADTGAIQALLEEAQSMIAEEAYLAAKFYDSRTRTKRSAINAYERFLEDYPQSAHADEIRARLEQLKGAGNEGK